MPGQAALPGFDAEPAPAHEGGGLQEHTLFFALRPDAAAIEIIEARRRAIRAAHAIAGKDVASERLHLTLYWADSHVGGLPAAMVEGARSVGGGIAGEPFDVVLDGVTSFDTGKDDVPHVLLAPLADNRPLLLFQQRIAAAMTAIGLKSPAGRGFTPHLTLLYGEQRLAPAPVEPVRWSVREFVLIESLRGRGVHRVLGRWPVGGSD